MPSASTARSEPLDCGRDPAGGGPGPAPAETGLTAATGAGRASAERAETETGRTASARRSPTLQEARALAHPLRVRALRMCLDQARTNSELAAALGQRPATMLYHVRTLLRTGFLAEDPPRPGPRGTVEKPYRATGKSARLDNAMTGEDGALLRATFEAVAHEVDEAGPDSVLEGTRMPLWLRPGELEEFLARVRALIEALPNVDQYLATRPAPDADPYALLLVVHKRAS